MHRVLQGLLSEERFATEAGAREVVGNTNLLEALLLTAVELVSAKRIVKQSSHFCEFCAVASSPRRHAHLEVEAPSGDLQAVTLDGYSKLMYRHAHCPVPAPSSRHSSIGKVPIPAKHRGAVSAATCLTNRSPGVLCLAWRRGQHLSGGHNPPGPAAPRLRRVGRCQHLHAAYDAAAAKRRRQR